MLLPRGSRSVSSVAFSSDNKHVVASDMSDNHYIHVFELEALDKKNHSTLKWSSKTQGGKIFMMQFSINEMDKFVSCGVNHIYFWGVNQNKGKKGIFGKEEIASFTSIAHSSAGQCYAAGANGKMYCWRSNSLIKVSKMHDNVIHSISITSDSQHEYLMTGGADKLIKVHHIQGNKLTLFFSVSCIATPKSLDFF